MSIQQVEMLSGIRRRMLRVIEGISQEEVLWIPDGFRNNILWNLGHTLVVQQIFHYQHTGQPLRIDEGLVEFFRSGTSPEDWGAAPDLTVVLKSLEDTPRFLARDFQEGRLSDYQSFTTKSGIEIANIDAALAFNEFHEGLHSGIIECMRRLWRVRSEGTPRI